MKPITSAVKPANDYYLDPGQFVHLSEIFLGRYWSDRGVRLIGTIGYGATESELALGNVSENGVIAHDIIEWYQKHPHERHPNWRDRPSLDRHCDAIHLVDCEAMERRAVLADCLMVGRKGITITKPKPNAGGGGKRFSALDVSVLSHIGERPAVDSVYANVPGYGIWFAPADCPIVSIAASKGKERTCVASFHFGYIPIGEGIGKVLRDFLSWLRSLNYDLAAHISAGTSSIRVYGDRVAPLKDLYVRSEFGNGQAEFVDNLDDPGKQDIIIRPGDYAQSICEDFIKAENIERDRIDTVTALDRYSQRAAANGQKMNGRNAHLLALVD